MPDTILLYILLIAAVVGVGLLVLLLARQKKAAQRLASLEAAQRQVQENLLPALDVLREMKGELIAESRGSRQELAQSQQQSLQTVSRILMQSQKDAADVQDQRLKQLDERFKAFSLANEQQLNQVRETVEKRLLSLQEDNNKKLESMRQTVDEKLQKTLEERLSQSFKMVTEHLEQVHKGLGEMQALASGVGDLKKVLSNVKTRGILGEIQLGSILREILSPEQYEENAAVKKNSQERVEFAIRLPGKEERCVYLPIDSKFPTEDYQRLLDAYEEGNPEAIEVTSKALERTVRGFAKTIRDKYVSPPETTDFAIMFLPIEGLYAEVIRRGLVETLQRDYKVNIAGPTTMAALLNSLQMGFKTLAIEKRSAEVWNVLGAVKTEFSRFEDVLDKTRKKLSEANTELEKLAGVRTRKIQSKLRGVMSLPSEQAEAILRDEEGARLSEGLEEDILVSADEPSSEDDVLV